MNAAGCRCVLAALSFSLLVFSGCGSSTGRRPLHGRVEIDGVAVTRGSISFLPAAGNPGPAANTVIVDGEYRFTGESGPYCGPHRVVIDIDPYPGEAAATGQEAGQDVKAVGKKAAGARARRPRPSRAKVTPTAKRHWEVEYTVPENGEYGKDFELGSL